MLNLAYLLQKLRIALFLLLLVWVVAAAGSALIASLRAEGSAAGALFPRPID